MRFGLPISIVLHLAILIWATISIGSAKPPIVPDPIPVNVSMLTATEFANLRKGSETSKAKTTAATPKEAEPADAPPVKAKRKADVAPTPKQDLVPKAEPEPPQPAPPKPEPPKPEPPKPEPDPPEPDPIAEQLAKPEPKKPEPVKAEPPKSDPITEQLAKPVPKRSEPPKPDPAKADPIAEKLKKIAALEPPLSKEPPKKAPKKKGFDITKLQAQINQLPDAAPDGGSDGTPDPQAKTTAAAIGVKKPTGTQLSATESQMFLGIFGSKVKTCWTVLAGATDARDLVVPVSFDLGQDGRLLSEPVVTGASSSPLFALAAENVVHAIKQCEPYALPPASYDKWRHWEIDFDPRAMFGG